MKHFGRNITVITIAFLAVVVLAGCQNPFQDDEEDNGTAPRVTDAGFVVDGDSTYTKHTALDVGTSYRFGIVVVDPDLDASTVTV
tara:strand:- start:84 stop:338 length:255 start_codon:yes stop_codon:yes gene_type:complete